MKDTHSKWLCTSVQNLCHLYPGMGLHFRVFGSYRDQNNNNSSDEYLILWSEHAKHEDKHTWKLHIMRKLWTCFVCMSPHKWWAKPEFPNRTSIADYTTKWGGTGVLESPLHICEWNKRNDKKSDLLSSRARLALPCAHFILIHPWSAWHWVWTSLWAIVTDGAIIFRWVWAWLTSWAVVTLITVISRCSILSASTILACSAV